MPKEFKKFDNVLGKLHGSKGSEPVVNKVDDELIVPPKKKNNRKRITFFVDEILEEYIDKGTLHEMYRSKSDFVEHILKEYFKEKAYLKK